MIPYIALQRERRSRSVEPVSDRTPSATATSGRVLSCAACLTPITRVEATIEVGGAHRHTFCNPHGIVFEIGCFSEAPGAVGQGRPETFFSWFPGYTWRVATCRRCRQHLGWSFGDDSFWGLVVDRLVENEH